MTRDFDPENPLHLDWAVLSQSNSRLIYKTAREDFHGEAAVVLQRLAAEVSRHTRWFLGIDETCTCQVHFFSAAFIARRVP